MKLSLLLGSARRPLRSFFAMGPLAMGTATLALFSTTAGSAAAGDVAVVSPGSLQQKIDGFGASSAWTASQMSQGDAALAFSKDTGVGLSLLRIRIQPCMTVDPCTLTTGEMATAVAAQSFGAAVWAAPWTPPAAWKINTSSAGGGLDDGSLDPANYDKWANALLAFVQSMKASGINLVGLSAQNEPDYRTSAPSYENCSYSITNLADFIGNHLGPVFKNAGLLDDGTFKLIGPETESWQDFFNYEPAIFGMTSPYLGIFATHAYGGGGPATVAAVADAQKSLWETEVYPSGSQMPFGDFSKPGVPPIQTGLWVAANIHSSLVNANANAWHYWWIYSTGGQYSTGSLYEGLWDATTHMPTKRLYAMGNFSKFVRPGFFRVKTQASDANVLVSAYLDQTSQTVVVVAINQGSSDQSQTFVFDGATTANWSAWLTSANDDLAQQSGTISGGNSFDYTLPASSITTLVGTVTGPGPAYVPPPPGSSVTMGHPNSGLACSSSSSSLAMKDAGTGAAGAGALVVFLALARRRRPTAR